MDVCRRAADAACIALSVLVRGMPLRTDQHLRVREVRHRFASIDEVDDEAIEALARACCADLRPRGRPRSFAVLRPKLFCVGHVTTYLRSGVCVRTVIDADGQGWFLSVEWMENDPTNQVQALGRERSSRHPVTRR